MQNFLPVLRRSNIRRNNVWDPGAKLTPSFSYIELVGEVGELANVVKKLERERLNLPGSRVHRSFLMEELADVVICLDLFLMRKDVPIIAPSEYYVKTVITDDLYNLRKIARRVGALEVHIETKQTMEPDLPTDIILRCMRIALNNGFYVEHATVAKFNLTSRKHNLPEFITE